MGLVTLYAEFFNLINKLYLKTLYQCKLFHLLPVQVGSCHTFYVAICINKPGSYKYICKYCFQGDGVNCSQMD